MTMIYTCEGPFLLVGEVRQALMAKIAGVESALEQAEDNSALEKKLVELNKKISALKGKHDDVSLGRKKCGYDLTSQINDIPFDGEDYEYECPKCGNKGRVMRMPKGSTEET